MKYLVFDLEYATSKGGNIKICEFGYVITNENFDILEKNNFIIDPNIRSDEWDWRALREILTRKKWQYEQSPRFAEYYDDICSIFEEVDYVFGHSLDGDAKALNCDCKRYNLPSIDFDFYDIKLFYKEYANVKKDVSVENIMRELNISGDKKTHDAEADAYNTMLELKKMVETLNITVEDLIYLCPKAKNKNQNYEVESIVINQMIREEQAEKYLNESSDSNVMRRGNANHRKFLQFLDNVQPQEGFEKKFNNKKFSISINYEELHYKQMLNIVQLLCNFGATYVLKGSESDYFIKYDLVLADGSIRKCSKLKYVNEAISEGKNIEIISFDEFMKMLEITEEELDVMPIPSFDCLLRNDAIIKDKKTSRMLKTKQKEEPDNSKNFGSSLGDLFKDLFDNFKNEN